MKIVHDKGHILEKKCSKNKNKKFKRRRTGTLICSLKNNRDTLVSYRSACADRYQIDHKSGPYVVILSRFSVTQTAAEHKQ